LRSGAAIAFIEAPESRTELEEIPKRAKHPLFANMLTGEVTPILSVKSCSNSATRSWFAPSNR